jgi:hypothetical protein
MSHIKVVYGTTAVVYGTTPGISVVFGDIEAELLPFPIVSPFNSIKSAILLGGISNSIKETIGKN